MATLLAAAWKFVAFGKAAVNGVCVWGLLPHAARVVAACSYVDSNGYTAAAAAAVVFVILI